MREGCKHGMEANSCTACWDEKARADTEAEIDDLTAKLQAAEADALLANMKLSSCMDETDRLRARIAKLEAELVKTREELIEQVLSTDIWLSFDGKEWVMVSAVRQALHGEVEK